MGTLFSPDEHSLPSLWTPETHNWSTRTTGVAVGSSRAVHRTCLFTANEAICGHLFLSLPTVFFLLMKCWM